MPNPQRILVFKLASRGDLILAARSFGRLRRARPDAVIDLCVGKSSRDVADHLPYFDSLRVVDDARILIGSLPRKLAGAIELWRIMRQYDEVIIMHRDWRYALIAMLAGVPIRRGFASAKANRFLTHPYDSGPLEHHSSQYYGVAGVGNGAGDGAWTFGAGEQSSAMAKVASFDDGSRPWVGLAFGGGTNVKSNTTLKNWPVRSFVDLARKIEAAGYRPVWLGDSKDASVLPADAPGVVFAGKLSVPETAVVISRCSAVVANDSMALHLADSLGVPSVGIFGPSEPLWTRPLRAGSSYVWAGGDMACSPCQKDGLYPPCPFDNRCMTEVPVARVFEATRSALEVQKG